MKKDCTLIATLHNLNRMEKVQRVFADPNISEVRFNTGSQTPFSVLGTLKRLKALSIKYKKTLWIDLKGRQLRVIKWADPLYSCIELNHAVNIEYPAKVYFRNGDTVNITHVKNGNKIFVDPLPRYAVGAGQSVNIIAKDLEVVGYLTSKDKQYLSACRRVGIYNIMTSFVESFDDLAEIREILPKAKIISKIEKPQAVENLDEIINVSDGIMVARGDLGIEISTEKVPIVQKTIIRKANTTLSRISIQHSFSTKSKRKAF